MVRVTSSVGNGADDAAEEDVSVLSPDPPQPATVSKTAVDRAVAINMRDFMVPP
jgi:hypothetical protein